MLETERYAEAVELLQFLLQCQGEDPRHYEEWQALLDWLIGAFPALKDGAVNRQDFEDEEETEEMLARRLAEAKLAEDTGYADKLLHTVRNKPLSEQTFLALEQLAYLDRPEIDDALIGWITREELHPLLQYRVLQTLRRRGTTGTLVFTRGGERIEVEIESIPLKPEDFPPAIQAVLDRVGDQTQVHDPTLFYFAQELWSQFVMALYGTVDYRSLLGEEDAVIDIWAAALHQMVADSLSGSQTDEEIRAMYGITDGLRLRYEQICRTLGKFVASGSVHGM